MLKLPIVERRLLVDLPYAKLRLARCCCFCRRDGIAVNDSRRMTRFLTYNKYPIWIWAAQIAE